MAGVTAKQKRRLDELAGSIARLEQRSAGLHAELVARGLVGGFDEHDGDDGLAGAGVPHNPPPQGPPVFAGVDIPQYVFNEERQRIRVEAGH